MRAVENIRGLNCDVFGERIGQETGITVSLRTGRNLRPVQCFKFRTRQTEHEVFRKSRHVALDLFVQSLGGNAINCGKIGIEHHLFTASDEDTLLDARRWNRAGLVGIEWCWAGRYMAASRIHEP